MKNKKLIFGGADKAILNGDLVLIKASELPQFNIKNNNIINGANNTNNNLNSNQNSSQNSDYLGNTIVNGGNELHNEYTNKLNDLFIYGSAEYQ